MAAGRKDSGGTEAERLALGRLAPSPHTLIIWSPPVQGQEDGGRCDRGPELRYNCQTSEHRCRGRLHLHVHRGDYHSNPKEIDDSY